LVAVCALHRRHYGPAHKIPDSPRLARRQVRFVAEAVHHLYPLRCDDERSTSNSQRLGHLVNHARHQGERRSCAIQDEWRRKRVKGESMWPDNETAHDFLNFSGVAETVAEIIVQAKGRPISIGISGARGIGKSSMIKLTQASLASRTRAEG
jgi:KAP family P-loop domain